MDYPVELRSGIPTDADMRKINAVSAYPLTADQVFIFRMRLCHNDVDGDFERFTTDTLYSLAKMYVGKPGIIKCQEVGRIYDTFVSADVERHTKSGDVYYEIIAHAYVLRSAISKEIIEGLIGNKIKKVSIGCSIASVTCSVCGEEDCSHIKGEIYDGKLCFKNLNSPLNAYEWAIVTNPKEPDLSMTIDDVIQYCYEMAEKLRENNSCDSSAAEHEQLAHWLEELKKLRVEYGKVHSCWLKSGQRIRALQEERDAAVDDLRKLVPAWKWDGAGKQQSLQEEVPKCGRVEFG